MRWMHRLGGHLVHVKGLLVHWSLLGSRRRVPLGSPRAWVARHLSHRSIGVAVVAGGKAHIGTHP